MTQTMINIRCLTRRTAPSGVVLMLVLFVVGIAALLGAAMISAASLYAQLSYNLKSSVQAQYLAESGANIALNYLQYPQKAPLLSNGFYPGQTGISLGGDVPGSIDIAVASEGNDTYDILATGTTGQSESSQISRQLSVRAKVNTGYAVPYGAAFAGNFTVPNLMSIAGDVRSDGVVTKSASATITGTVYAQGASNIPDWTVAPTFPTHAVPTLNQINLKTTIASATPHYTYTDGSGNTQTGYPQLLSATVSGTLVAANNNPKGVWYTNGSVTLSDCIVNGTIVVTDASKPLIVSGNAQVTAQSAMPAVIAAGPIQYAAGSATKSLTVGGLCWIGGNVESTGAIASNCALTINGALMMASATAQINANISGSVAVNYDNSKVLVPDFASSDRTPISIHILHWGS